MVAVPIASTIDATKPWIRSRQQEYYLTNATIIDPYDGSIHPNMTVHVSHGIIESISATLLTQCFDRQQQRSESHGTVVDLSGKYLCPGLIDCHVHLATPPGEDGLHATMNQDPSTSLLRQPWLARQMLNRGFTSIRDCGGASLALKEAFAEGLHPGPRLFISVQAISQTGGHGDKRSAKAPEVSAGGCLCNNTEGVARVADGVDACLLAARSHLRQGADFLKIMCSGGVASPTDSLLSTQYSGAEISAMTEAARSAGTYVTAHAYTPASIKHAISHGVRGIEHGNFIDQGTAELMARNNVFLTPTLVTYETMASPAFRDFLPRGNAAKNLEVLKAGLQSIRVADAAGVTMCYGTDLLGPLQIRQTGEFALRARVLPALRVLQSATVNAARLVGYEGRLGRLLQGYIADLIILDRNPLDDVAILDRPDQCLLAVVKEGRVMMSKLSCLPSEV